MKLVAGQLFVLFLFLVSLMANAHDSEVYSIENAELNGTCSAIVSLGKAGLPMTSPYIQSIIDSHESLFGTKNLKKAINVCIQVTEKQQQFALESASKVLENALSGDVIKPLTE